MKIAICLSGHFRTYNKKRQDLRSVHESWDDSLYTKHDCDVFLHTWDVDGRRIGYDRSDETANEDMTEITASAEELKSQFGFKDVVIENYTDFHSRFRNESARAREKRNEQNMQSRRITHLYSMWYKVQKCFELVPKDTEYDLVIRSRPDLFVSPDIDVEHLEWEILTIPWYNQEDEPHDYFAIGNYEAIRTYSNLYDHMDIMLNTITMERFLNPHQLLYYYLQYRNIRTTKMINTFELVR